MTNTRSIRWILGLMLVATIVNGLLAGGNVDRSFVAMPAWRHTGPVAWAQFSRYADLGNGQVLYPAMAISGTLLCVLAAIAFMRTRRRPQNATWPILLGAVFMLVSLPISFKAAPFMLSLRHINNDDVAATAIAFMGFEFWGRIQGGLHVAAFISNLWSIVTLGQHSRP